MAERNAGRPWTGEEDKLLQQGVERFGEQENWKTIAVSIPGRTNKACRKRWLHSLSPNVKKTAWTAEEDQKLLDLYDQQGPKWSVIARQIPGRTDDACSKRYREALDPCLKKDVWTPEEDQKLNQAHIQHGMKWGLIGQELQRSGLACRNRWRLIERKRAARAALVFEDSGRRTLSIVTQRPSHESVSLFPYSQLGNTFHESSPPPGSPVLTPSISPHSPNVVSCGFIPRAFPEEQAATPHDHQLLDPQVHTPSYRPGTITIYNDAQHSLTDFITNQQDLGPLLSAIFGQPLPCETANESVGLRDFATTSVTIQGATTTELPHTDAREVSSIGFDRFQDLNSKAILTNDGTANYSGYFDSVSTAKDTASITESQADMMAIDNTVNRLQNFDLETFSRDIITSSDRLNFKLGTVLADIMTDVRASDFRSHVATDKPLDLDVDTLQLSSDFPTEHSRDFAFEALLANGTITNHSRDSDLAPRSPRQPSDLPFDPLLIDSFPSGPTQSGCTRSNPMQFLQSDSLRIGPLLPDPIQSNPLRTQSLQFDLWKSSNFTDIVSLLPRETSYLGLNFSSSHDDLPSTQSTPSTMSSSMSPISSPNSTSPANLSNKQLPTGSILHLQDSLSSVPRRRKPRKTKGRDAASRLSSNLPLSSDPKVRPYACGREGCWSIGASMSKSCFATSKQLFEHSKGDHEGEPLGDKPFRCGLSGCGKSWKSINGLQYHLQLSAAHFRNALSSQFSAHGTGGDLQTDSVDLFPDDSHRTYACPMPNCFKAYRQHSGLRYHLLHGHPEHMPVQLPLVPPALARQLPAKARKMRRKQSS